MALSLANALAALLTIIWLAEIEALEDGCTSVPPVATSTSPAKSSDHDEMALLQEGVKVQSRQGQPPRLNLSDIVSFIGSPPQEDVQLAGELTTKEEDSHLAAENTTKAEWPPDPPGLPAPIYPRGMVAPTPVPVEDMETCKYWCDLSWESR